jgi:hypothetical protein
MYFTHPITHSLTHSLTRPLTHSLTHWLTHRPTKSLTGPPTHSLTCPLTRPFTHRPTHSLTDSLTICRFNTTERKACIGPWPRSIESSRAEIHYLEFCLNMNIILSLPSRLYMRLSSQVEHNFPLLCWHHLIIEQLNWILTIRDSISGCICKFTCVLFSSDKCSAVKVSVQDYNYIVNVKCFLSLP